MYKKYIAFLLLFQAAVLVTFLNVKGIELNRIIAAPAFRLTLEQMQEENCVDYMGILTKAASGLVPTVQQTTRPSKQSKIGER